MKGIVEVEESNYADHVGLVKQMKNGKVIYELLKQTAY